MKVRQQPIPPPRVPARDEAAPVDVVVDAAEKKAPEATQNVPAGTSAHDDVHHNALFDKVTSWAAQHFGHQDPEHPHGPKIITHERPVVSGSVFAGVVELGFTFSELNQVRDQKGIEIVHVVNPDGTGNIEMLFSRFSPKWMHGHRFGLQGPAINTDAGGISARFAGLELTSDLKTAHSKDALSYTLEVKLTDKSVAVLASMFAPGIAHEIGQALASHASTSVAKVIGNIFMGAVPFISGGIALVSCRRAIKVLKNQQATKEQKIFAVGHAVADLVRVVLPMPGTLMNVALVAASAVSAGIKLHQARAQLAKSEAG